MSFRPLCITGMHRSNTSMLTRMLHTCGMFAGPSGELMAGDDPSRPDIEQRYRLTDNPDGYWEDSRFLAINDQILALFGGDYGSPPCLQEGWVRDPRLEEAKTAAITLVDSEPKESCWLWKDPRTSLTLAFWKELIRDLQVIVVVRHPLEVAASMTKRAILPITFQQTVSMWGDYYSRVIEDSENIPRLVTHSDSYFLDPSAELRRVLEFAGYALDPDTLASAAALVNPRQRRSSIVQSHADQITPEIESLYRSLCDQCGPVYDRLRSDPDLDRMLKSLSLEEALARIDELQNLLSLRADAYAALDEDRKRTAGDVAELQGTVADLQSQLQALAPYERWIGLIKPFFRAYHAIKRTK